MLSPHEVKLLKDGQTSETKKENSEDEKLFLTGVVYHNHKKWTIWVNKKAYRSPEGQPLFIKGFRVLKVTECDVTFENPKGELVTFQVENPEKGKN